MSPVEEDPKTMSTTANEFFESIGNQADQLAPAANDEAQTDDDDRRVVEEIESLCMNCHENVSRMLPHTTHISGT